MYLSKGLLALFAVFYIAEATSIDDNVQEFLKGMRELEKHSGYLDGLLTRTIGEQGALVQSREELEDDKGHVDDSASQESAAKEVTTKKTEVESPSKSEEDDPEDDIVDDEDIDDVRDTMTRGFTTLLTSFPGLLGVGQQTPWWRGPHVCVDHNTSKEEAGTSPKDINDEFITFGSFLGQFSTCQNTNSRYTCKTITKRNGVTETSVTTHRCCHGYKLSRTKPECVKVEMKTLDEIATEFGAEKFIGLLRTSPGFESTTEGNMTVLLPTDEAMATHHQDIDAMNQLETNEISSGPVREHANIALSHTINELVEVGDIVDEMTKTTADGSTVRFNILPNNDITVNCIRLNKTDIQTEKGVFHVIDGVLVPVTENLGEKLNQPQFSKFKNLLVKHDLFEPMNSKDRKFTVFAVEDKNFDEVDTKYSMCIQNIVAHHLLPHTLCSATGDYSERLATLDVNRNWLPFTKVNGTMIIGNRTKVQQADIMATNGILHVAESFVIPSRYRLLSELLNQTNHSEWLSVLERSGLLSDIEQTEKVIMFVPTNRAVKEAIADDVSIDELQRIVKFHVGKELNGFAVSTLLDGQNISISPERNMFSRLLGPSTDMTIQCTPLSKVGGRVCNGVLHELDAVIKPPKQTLWDFIQQSDSLTQLRKILEGTRVADELKEGLPFTGTFLAPTNEAFDGIGVENQDILLKDKSLADEIIRSHILKEPVCCNNIVTSTWPFVPTSGTLSGRPIELNRRGHVTSFGTMQTVDCNNIVVNGLVHLVNGVRLGTSRPRDREVILRRPNSEIILAGI